MTVGSSPQRRAGLLDQLAAGAVDRLVDLRRSSSPGSSGSWAGWSGSSRCVAEVAGVVGAHEVDAEELEVGLELEGEPADVRGLVDVLDEPARRSASKSSHQRSAIGWWAVTSSG